MHQAPRELWPPQFEAAIFDFDGTLAHTADLWHEVDLAFLRRRGIAYTPDYAQRLSALGFVDGAAYTIERYGLDETVEQVCDEWTRMSRELYQTTVRLRPGAEDYVRSLRERGIPCALATTNEAAVLGSMRHVDVDTLFDACVYGSDVGCGKDRPDIYLEAARRLGAGPQGCMVFEDIVPAVLSARRAGMRACAVRAKDPSQDWEGLCVAADLLLEDWRHVARR